MTEDLVEFGLEGEEAVDRPRVVDEAHEVLQVYHLQMGGSAMVAVVAWVGALLSGTVLPVSWLAAALAIIVLLVLSPVTREPRLARDVLRRWDELRVERALASSGVTDDPRYEVAEAMADRIVRHPSSDERVRAAAAAMLRRLRRLLDDLGRTNYLAQSRLSADRAESSRSISDLQDLLDARAAEVLARLAGLHRTVVLRDTTSLDGVLQAVEDLAHELEAEQVVEQLLSDAERQ